MSEHPAGVVAFLFTDIVSSTRLWADAESAMDGDLRRHDSLMRDAAAAHSGYVFATAGDSFGIAFESASQAVRSAIDAQQAIAAESWQVPGGIAVRMGVHLGEAIARDGDYFGTTLNVASRVMSAGHGGQILVSGSAAETLRDQNLTDLGTHRLRDVAQPMAVHQVQAEGLVSEHPPLHTLDAYTSTLPQQRSSFVGRDEEVLRVRTMIERARLVTITGVGGAGKTRVAVEVGAAEQPNFPGGVFFVDLAKVDDEDELVAAVVAGIDLKVSSVEALKSELDRFLRDRDVLLIMDNCEHLLDPVADLLDELFATASRLKVLATSREALEIDGEESYRLPSLAAEGAAFRLFVDRATAVNDRFEVDDSNRNVIVDLCKRVDGMPLAIELAASRCRTSTPSELLAGLDDRFSLLRAGRKRGVVARQRTLEATIEWSYELLEPEEQQFFRRLGTFFGSFVAQVVPAVTDTSAAVARDLLDSLVAKSLVTAEPLSAGEMGFRLLETVKAFAIDRLVEHGDVDAAGARHADAYVEYARPLAMLPFAEDQVAIDGYLAQLADLHTAADYLIEAQRYDDAALILRAGHYSVVGTGSVATAALSRVECILDDHFEHLSDPWKAALCGTHGALLMDAGRFLEAGAAAARGIVQPNAPIEYRVTSFLTTAIISGSGNADEGLALVERARKELADSGAHGLEVGVIAFGAILLAGKRDYVGVLESMTENFQFRSANELYLPSIFWFCHLLGREPKQEWFEAADAIRHSARGYLHSIPLARIMATDDDHDRTAGAIAAMADRVLTGRLPLGESEFLIAYARLAALRGEQELALDLVEHCAPRAPWTNAVMCEVIGSIKGWPEAEWSEHFGNEMTTRAQPEAVALARERMPKRLEAELVRWR